MKRIMMLLIVALAIIVGASVVSAADADSGSNNQIFKFNDDGMILPGHDIPRKNGVPQIPAEVTRDSPVPRVYVDENATYHGGNAIIIPNYQEPDDIKYTIESNNITSEEC